MNQSATFSVSYDGEALDTHIMDVRDLAPALLSLGQLFDEANRVLNQDKTSVKLNVKAQKQGSFEIVMELSQTLPSQISGFLTGDLISSALNLKELVLSGCLGVGGLIWLVKKLKGKKPQNITDLKNGFIRVEIDGETLEVPLNLLRLYQDLAVRRAVSSTLKPLESEGITSFQIKDSGKVVESVYQEDLQYFVVPEVEDEVVLETQNKAAYSIISLAFKDDNKWRLHDGNATINATIKDFEFLEKVNNNQISFAKGDVLVCMVKTTQRNTNDGLKTEYEVLEVLEHKQAYKQLSLFDIPIEIDESNL